MMRTSTLGIVDGRIYGRSGQALLEFVGGVAAWVPLILLVGWTFYDEWIRLKCAYETFEITHLCLIGVPSPGNSTLMQIVETPHFVQGVKMCGSRRETVTLPKLESAQW